MVRAASAGVDPQFITMIRQLITERITNTPEKAYMGDLGPSHDVCPVNCCLSGSAYRPAIPAATLTKE
jgi:ferrochelatase